LESVLHLSGKLFQAIEFAEKQYRAAQKPGWEHDLKLFELYATATLDLSNVYMIEGSSNSLYSAKSKVKALIKKAEVSRNC